MINLTDIKKLAAYYRDIISAVSQQSGKHLIDLGSILKYGLVADFGLFIDSINYLLEKDRFIINIERSTVNQVNVIMAKTELEFETQDEDLTLDISEEEYDKNIASARLQAIYRKQEQDKYNRETTIGFPIVTGKYGSRYFCGPLFYFTVQLDFDPLTSHLTINKEFSNPMFNSSIIAKMAMKEDDLDSVRRSVYPLMLGEFNLDTITKVVKILSNLIEAFSGAKYIPGNITALKSALDNRNKTGLTIHNAISIANSARSNAFLMDELLQIEKLETLDGLTVLNTLLSITPENISDQDSDKKIENIPLLFPFESNAAQRKTARLAGKSKLMVIQGPPGTGKSHTIANLVCDLVAKGHSVLITSHQNKALQVIEEKLPSIDFLAMSLLKGEKRSTEILKNQLSNIDGYVGNLEIFELESVYKRFWDRIINIEKEIQKLSSRFSELKTLERDKYHAYSDTYFKYYDIKEYDIIHPQDSFREIDEFQNLKDLKSWCEAFMKIKNYYHDLGEFFNLSNLQIEHIRKIFLAANLILDLYKNYQKISEDKEYRDFIAMLEGCHKSIISIVIESAEIFNQWLGINGETYQQIIDELRENGFSFSLAELINWSQKMGKIVLLELEVKIESIINKANQVIQDFNQHNRYKPINSIEEFQDLKNAANIMSEAGLIQWYLPRCRQARNNTAQYFSMNRLKYKDKHKFIDNITPWLQYWEARRDIYQDSLFISDINFPFGNFSKPIDLQSSLNEFIKKTNFLKSVSVVIKAIKELKYKKRNRPILNLFFDLLDNTYKTNELKLLIEKTLPYYNNLSEFSKLKEFAQGIASLSTYVVALEDIINTKDWQKYKPLFDELSLLLSMYPPLLIMIELEQDNLSGLKQTINLIREDLLDGQNPNYLTNLDKVIEAHRLRTIISNQIDPDDINEITNEIKKLKKERSNLIIKCITAKRKGALRYALSHNDYRQQIIKLRKILSKKKKTVSFVQFKEQIKYEKLLTVFPCWIMSIEDVARVFPLKEGLFDYLIVDEASQCNQAMAFHLAYRAKKMIVVGDEKQLKNSAVRFLSDNIVKMLLSKHGLITHEKVDFLHGRESLLSLADYSSNISVFLNEHFRCEPPIIAWSNKNFYDERLIVLTPFRSQRFTPCLEVKLVRGADDNPDLKQNRKEAEALISELKHYIQSGKCEGMSIGIMSLYREQANLLQTLLYEEIEQHPDWLKKYEIIVSTADGFQGDERDIIFYSMRYGVSSSPGVINAIQNEPERINVAFSRARRKQICFISRPIEEFPKGLIKDFLEHANRIQYSRKDPFSDNVEDKFDSEFEKHVCHALRNRGLEVYTQVPCAGFFIDMVVIDENGRRLAVECDGDFHYEEDGSLRAEDYQRQDIIERSGWLIHRLPARRFYLNPGKAIDEIINDLNNQEVISEIDTSIDIDKEVEQVRNESKNQLLKPAKESHKSESDIYGFLNHVIKEIEEKENLKIQIINQSSSKLQTDTNLPQKSISIKKTKSKKPSVQKVNVTTDQQVEIAEGASIWHKNIWFSLSKWGKETNKLNPWERNFCYNVGVYISRSLSLSKSQEIAAKSILAKVLRQGFSHPELKLQYSVEPVKKSSNIKKEEKKKPVQQEMSFKCPICGGDTRRYIDARTNLITVKCTECREIF